ncbi:MAG: NAD(P)H-hydrate dehydratase [Leptolyngbyaceae cyanobacterium]
MNVQSGVSFSAVASVVVTTRQMQMIESTLFAAGLPETALMEKVAGKVANWIMRQFPCDRAPAAGIIVGPGHNGGDALVVARELYHRGYRVLLWCPFSKLKDLTACHKAYLDFLNLDTTEDSADLRTCDFIVDGGFGIGLTRPLSNDLAAGITALNASAVPIVSIDVPSGLNSDTGAVQGTAVCAQHTLCLGLWKLGLLQDQAQPWVGQLHLLPFDIPALALQKTLTDDALVQCITAPSALSRLPLPRSPVAHKYTAGHLLLVAGSRQYGGAALLAGQGALASGVGMLTLVVPESLRLMVLAQLPEALVIGTSETSSGAIAALPESLEWPTYDAVACGPGLTLAAAPVVTAILRCDRPVVFDADALNILAQNDPQALLSKRSAATLLTPHPGEFRRLFPEAAASMTNLAAQQAAQSVGCTVILKGAMTAIAHADGQLWINRDSTPALARGGSGDVLTGLVAGLAAQKFQSEKVAASFLDAAIAAVWWHAQAGCYLADQGTELGCAAGQLGQTLPTALARQLQQWGTELTVN